MTLTLYAAIPLILSGFCPVSGVDLIQLILYNSVDASLTRAAVRPFALHGAGNWPARSRVCSEYESNGFASRRHYLSTSEYPSRQRGCRGQHGCGADRSVDL